MKFLEILLISSFILISIKPECIPELEDLSNTTKLRNYDDCEKRTTTSELKENDAYKCCYLGYTVDSDNLYAKVHTCTLITQSQYNNIKDLVKNYESSNKVKNVKIKCTASYIHIGLFYLLLLIIY